jgi:hypothetical protein
VHAESYRYWCSSRAIFATQETWEERVAVASPASHKDAQSKTMLIAPYALRPSTGSARNPGTRSIPG